MSFFFHYASSGVTREAASKEEWYQTVLMEGGVRGRITVNVPGPAAEEFPIQRDIVIIHGK